MSNIQSVSITGASGHFGTAIVLEALDRGIKVKAGYSSYKPDIEHENLTWLQGDLSTEPLQALIEGTDAVIHVAAIISVDGDKDGRVKRTNVDGTRNLIDVVKAQGNCRLIFISSATVAEEYPHKAPFNESRPLKGATTTAYEHSKILCEKMLSEEADLDYVILRPSGIFGPPDLRTSTIGKVLLELYKGEMPILTTGGYDFVDVRDLAIATVNSLERGRLGEVYLLTGQYFKLKKVAKMLHQHGGAKPPRTIPLSFVLGVLPLLRIVSDNDSNTLTKEGLNTLKDGHPKMSHQKAVDELGYHARAINESLAELIDWWKEAGIVD